MKRILSSDGSGRCRLLVGLSYVGEMQQARIVIITSSQVTCWSGAQMYKEVYVQCLFYTESGCFQRKNTRKICLEIIIESC